MSISGPLAYEANMLLTKSRVQLPPTPLQFLNSKYTVQGTLSKRFWLNPENVEEDDKFTSTCT